MKKIRLAIIAAAMITSLLPLNSFAANITASGDATNNGIAYDIVSDNIQDFINVEVKGDRSTTVTFDGADTLGSWGGYTTFSGKIIINNVLGAKAANKNFAVGEKNYNLYKDYAVGKTTSDIKKDTFAQGICEQVGVAVTNGVVDTSNPMYDVKLEDGVLTVKDVVNENTTKDVNITVNGVPVETEGKVVTGDSVNVMFEQDNETVLTDANRRVWVAAEKMNAKLKDHTEHGVESIKMNKAGTGVSFGGVTVEMGSEFGDWAAFTVKENSKNYLIKNFADSGVIEMFQAMFGDVVTAEISDLVIADGKIVKGSNTKTIENMNTLDANAIKSAVAENLIALLVTGKPGEATMDQLEGKAAVAKVTFADGNTETYSVAFLPYGTITLGETTANVN